MQAYREGQGDKPKGGFAGSVSFYGLGKQFTALRRDTPWLQELSFAPVRYVLKRQAEAFERFFDGGGYPRCKSRRGGDSVTLPDQVRIDGDRLWVPKLGWYRFRRRGGNPTERILDSLGYQRAKPVQAVIRREWAAGRSRSATQPCYPTGPITRTLSVST